MDALIRLVRSLRQTPHFLPCKKFIKLFFYEWFEPLYSREVKNVFLRRYGLIPKRSKQRMTRSGIEARGSADCQGGPVFHGGICPTCVYPHVPSRSISLRLRSRSFGDFLRTAGSTASFYAMKCVSAGNKRVHSACKFN